MRRKVQQKGNGKGQKIRKRKKRGKKIKTKGNMDILIENQIKTLNNSMDKKGLE